PCRAGREAELRTCPFPSRAWERGYCLYEFTPSLGTTGGRSPLVFHHDRLRQIDQHPHWNLRRLPFRRGRGEDEAHDPVTRFALAALAADQELQVFPPHGPRLAALIEALHLGGLLLGHLDRLAEFLAGHRAVVVEQHLRLADFLARRHVYRVLDRDPRL